VHQHVEHDQSALAQARHVAHALLGRPTPARGPSWFWSDQYDHTLQYGGRHDPGDALLWRGDSTGFYLRDGRVTGVVAVDAGREFRRALPLVSQRVDLSLLLDPDVDLRRLLPATSSAA
jgi:3-phenylpropionate/trans-cinnamate dioxygenase ferredoxin reductase subunit